MAVRFVIGRAGTGKTRHCVDAIVADMRATPLDGPPIYFLLPKQATFSAERELTTMWGLRAFSRARVLSFELLGEEVLAACGGAAVPEVSAIGRQMLLGFLLRERQDRLKFFRGVARQPGLAARLDATFAEFERCGKDPAALAELVDDIAPGSGDDIEANLLRDKLTDFHELFRAYRDALGDERVDPHRRLEQVLSCIGKYAGLRDAAVFVDGFLEFSDRERRMIVALAKAAASVEITMTIDPASPTIRDVHRLPDEFSLFHRTESQYRLLAIALKDAGVVVEPPLLLRAARRFEEKALAAIEVSLFADLSAAGPRSQQSAAAQLSLFEAVAEPGVPAVLAQPKAESIELVEAPDRRTEVDAAARRIRAALREGRRLRDIAVLVRDIDDYEELIAASFREHEIPYFVDRRRTAGHHPLIQFTRAIFQIARGDWPHDAVMSLVKSGLGGVELAEADELENYALLHRIAGGAGWADPQPWAYDRKLTRGREDEEDLDRGHVAADRIDRLRRRVVDRITPFTTLLRGGERRTLREIVIALFELFARFNVRETIGGWIDDANARNQPEERGEPVQGWAELINLFDQMVDLLGERTVDLGDFVEILDVGLERFDLALTPPRVDQVLVGQVERTRTTTLDTVFLLGLAEGQFPKIAREDSVLSDAERRRLRDRNLDVDPDSERRLLDERLLGYLAFTRASRRLVVSRATSAGEKTVNASSFWQRLRQMFPENLPTQERRESEAGHDAIGTPRQLVTALMRWARDENAAADAQQPWGSLYSFLVEHKNCDDAIGVMRYRAWRALGYRNDARLSRDVAEQLVPREWTASVTRIESFAACPFQHFARHSLGLSVREDAEVTAMDLGNVYHNVLERVVGRVLEQKTDLCSLDPAAARALISQYAAEVGKNLRGELMLSTARNQYLLKHIEKTLERVCATQKAVLSRGAFRPARAELKFGMDDDSLPPLVITTKRGRTISLRGKIDRVDVTADGREVAVIDYKMRSKRLDLASVLDGLSLQLLTYLLVLQANGATLFERQVTPVAAFYAQLVRGLKSVKHPRDAMEPDHPEFDTKGVKPRGVFHADYLDRLDADLESGSSTVVHCYVKQSGDISDAEGNDAAAAEAFAALMGHVRALISRLADKIADGVITIRPYRMGDDSPCARCDFRSVCRFDAALNGYRIIQSLKRADAIERLLAGMTGGGDGEA
jgi:ATP-dependent helicase/nuclease subunit B